MSWIEVIAIVLAALLPLLVEWLEGRQRRQEDSGEGLQDAQEIVRDALADALGAGDGDAVAAAFGHHEMLRPYGSDPGMPDDLRRDSRRGESAARLVESD